MNKKDWQKRRMTHTRCLRHLVPGRPRGQVRESSAVISLDDEITVRVTRLQHIREIWQPDRLGQKAPECCSQCDQYIIS